MTDRNRSRGFPHTTGVSRQQADDPALDRPMWWCVDLVRAYSRGWRADIANLMAGASQLEHHDMKITLPVLFKDVNRWRHELTHDPQRQDLVREIQRRTRFSPPEHRAALTAAIAEAEASGKGLASITLTDIDDVHLTASTTAAAGIAYMGIARFEQHLNDKNRFVERLLGRPRSAAFPPLEPGSQQGAGTQTWHGES